MNESNVTEKGHLWPQYLTGLTVTLMAVSCGIHFGWPSPAIPKLEIKDLEFDVSLDEISYVVILYPLGFLIGCPLCAILLDRIGRKCFIILITIPQICAWVLIANSTQVYMLYVARLTAGLAEGGSISSLPVYVCEISEPKIRGILGYGYSIGLIFGSFLINIYGSYMPLRTSAYASLCFPVAFLVSFIWAPESPYFLLMKGRTDDTRKSLQKLRRMKNVEDELSKLTAAVERQISEPNSMKDVFTERTNLKAFLILVGMRTVQQFAGGAAISFFNQMIFQEAGGSVSYIAASIIYNGVLLVCCCCFSFIVDGFRRKALLIFSSVGVAICLLLEGLYFSFKYYEYDMSSYGWLPITAMIFYTIFRAVGMTPIPTIMTGELFSASIKAKAVGLVNIYLALCLSVSSKLFHWLASTYGMHTPFFLYTVCCTLGIFFIHYCVPETKDKTLEEIQQQLKGGS